MKVLITGANGFIAKNLREHLKTEENIHIYSYSKNDSLDILRAYLKEVDFVFHLAGVNRSEKDEDFRKGNVDLTQFIVQELNKASKKVPILYSSSIQAELDNVYGKSKRDAENILLDESNKMPVHIFRLPNVFGKWGKPQYNSVICTWCYNIANDLDIVIHDETTELKLVYVDDVISAFKEKLSSADENKFCEIDTVYKKTLAEIRDLLYLYRDNRKSLCIPAVGKGFERALYSTYLSYLPINNFSYKLKGHEDERGTFYEMLKTQDSGQFSISTSVPGITRGNHFHHTKNEKFLVVKGKALIEFRHIVTNEKIAYEVSDGEFEVVEMIPGYTHNITNIGNEKMILLLWANENFDLNNPDTYFLEV